MPTSDPDHEFLPAFDDDTLCRVCRVPRFIGGEFTHDDRLVPWVMPRWSFDDVLIAPVGTPPPWDAVTTDDIRGDLERAANMVPHMVYEPYEQGIQITVDRMLGDPRILLARIRSMTEQTVLLDNLGIPLPKRKPPLALLRWWSQQMTKVDHAREWLALKVCPWLEDPYDDD